MRCVALVVVLAFYCRASVTRVDELRDKFYNLESKLWKNVSDPEWVASGLADVELTKAFVAYDGLIQSVPIPPRLQLDSWLWSRAVEKFQIIDGFYKNFVKFIRSQAQPGTVPAPVREWLDISESVLLDPETSVAQSVRKISDLLEHGDMFRSVLQEEHPDLCELQMSPHQLIYDMYNTISLTEIKGYAMMQFSWMLLRIYGKGNFTQEASITRKRYGERTARTAVAARAALAMARREVYRCDPPEHKLGETYAEVTRLLQGYIENEVNLNMDGTCRENCPYYTLSENFGCYDPKQEFCSRQPECKGRLINCQYVDSDMEICPAGRKSSRRYEHIKYKNGLTYGKVATCPRREEKVNSWWRAAYHCSYCMCLCDESHGNSERYFSLREALADYRHRKVVTGIRIIKHGQVFHLQVSEGQLGERGFVSPGGWVPVQKFAVSDAGVRDGEDYHTLTYEKRAMDLDELESPLGHVLTGVRFRMIGAHLHFEIRSTPFNYTTGRLSPDRSQWISNDNTDAAETPRSKLGLIKPDIPTRSLVPLRVDSKHDQYVEFVNSDFEADAAQSTVPFIDIQPVEPMKGSALLSGAGVLHRGAPGSGGFLAVKLVAYDQSRHVTASPPPAETEEEMDFMPPIQ